MQAAMEDLAAMCQEQYYEPPLNIPELLEKGSPLSRAVLLLHHSHDLTLDAIAAIPETNIGTIKSRLAYGLASLRNQLERKK